MRRVARALAGGRAIATALGLASVTALAFGRMVWDAHPFIHLDDWQYVVQNPRVNGGLSLESLRWAFRPDTFVANNWHPVTLVSHMLDCTLFGAERPAGHHGTSLLLHVTNVVLVFVLLLRSTGALWASACVAALFAWHPTRVESVAWVAERKDVLSGTFGLLTLVAYGAWVRRGGLLRHAVVLALFALGLMSKSMLVTLPFALLLLDVWPLRRIPFPSGPGAALRAAGPLVREKVPLFALALAFTAMAFVSQGSTGAVADLHRVPLIARLANATTAYWEYLGMLIWPTGLTVLYPITQKTLSVAGMLASLGGLLAASALALRWGRAFPFVPVGWAGYLGTLVPVIGLVQLGSQALADRYLYLPALGAFTIVAFGLRELGVRHPGLRWPLAAATGIWLAVLAGLTFVQTGYWRDTRTLFERNVEVAGANETVWNALGAAYDEAGETERAIEAYARAIEANPGSAGARLAIGSIRMRQGNWSAAVESLEHAANLGIGSVDPRVHVWLGNALGQVGRHDDAAEHLAIASAREPDRLPLRLRHALALEAAGRGPEALAALETAMRRHPNALEPQRLTVKLLSTPAPPHDPARAVALATRLVAASPRPIARYSAALATAYGAAGQREEERAAARRALPLARRERDAALVRELEARLDDTVPPDDEPAPSRGR